MVIPSISERPVSTIPLTGDRQTDSDILAFIKARQSILQKKCKCASLGSPPRPPSPALFANTWGRGCEGEAGARSRMRRKEEAFCGLLMPRDRPSQLYVPGLCFLLEKVPWVRTRNNKAGASGGQLSAHIPLAELALALPGLQLLLFSVPKDSSPAQPSPNRKGLSDGLVIC